jgi:DNA-binding protein WhiA
VNCETANLEKTVNASVKQVEIIRMLDEILGLENLPAGLKEIARLRLENPEASLTELGKMLAPPLGKSGVNHRLRKLEKIASDRIDINKSKG